MLPIVDATPESRRHRTERSRANSDQGEAHFKVFRRMHGGSPQGAHVTDVGRRGDTRVKWLVISLFFMASLSALLWFESSERNYTPAQKTALLVTSLTAWTLVLFLAATMT